MVSLETIKMPSPYQGEPGSSPRISFSAEFLDESDFISISPTGEREEEAGPGKEKLSRNPADPNFEFLSDNVGGRAMMLTADELFSNGKLLPFWAEKLDRISLKSGGEEECVEEGGGGGGGEAVGRTGKEPRPLAAALAPPMGISWSFIDDDPSPRPPKCTVLWKELLRLKKHQRPNFSSSSLSPSSSSSSTSSSSGSMADAAAADDKKKKKKKKTATKTVDNHENNDVKGYVKRVKNGLERTRSTSIRIRPMVNVPICTPVSRGGGGSGAALPPLFPLKKGRV